MAKWTRALRSPLVMYLALGHLVFFCVLALRAAGSLEFMELAAYDLHLRLRPGVLEPDRRIVLIEATEADLRTYGWPLPDGVLAALLRRLAAHRPQAIGVDIYRDIPVPPGHARLEALMARNRHIFFVMKFGDEGEGRVAPPSALADTDRVGFADVVTDPGGVVRRGLLFLDDGYTVAYSLPLRLALNYLAAHGIAPSPAADNPQHMRLGDITLPPFERNDGGYVDADARGYQVLLDFGGAPPSGFRRYALADVLTGRIEPQAVKNKIVIVGVAAESVKDYFYTPYSRGLISDQRMFGITLHAHAVSQLLRAGLDATPSIATLSERTEVAWTWLWTLLGGLIGLRIRSVRWFSALVAAGLAALALIGYWEFLQRWWVPSVAPGLGWLLSAGLVTSYVSNQEKEQRAMLMQIFSRYIPSSVAESLWRQREQFLEGGRPLPQRLTATVFFSDLRGFTSVSEQLEPRALMDWLNAYMEAMAKVVMDHGGVVDKFIGDAIMAVFGVPLARHTEAEIRQDAVHAVDCAVAMERELTRLNAEWRTQGLPTIGMRIGIFTGPLVAGSLGSSDRMEYTAIGDTVNIASRLESLDKDFADPRSADSLCRILIGETTMKYLGDKYETVQVGTVRLKGRLAATAVYRVWLPRTPDIKFPAKENAT
ncbi:MAG: CHASE2 domain-containing protein [Gammaproteobacteria bacterium]